jgi:ribosomal protein S18 acetylase RimI-like enzyme
MGARVIHRRSTVSGLRRSDIARDLGGVADLLEQAFAGDLEEADLRWLQEMKAFRFLAPFLWFASRTSPWSPGLFAGFVWVEDGRLVGNVNVTRADMGWRHWQISNVAVHPAYRRRGIARELVEAAIELVRQQGGEVVTLQVRRANRAAQTLYRSLGFDLLAGTTSLTLERMGPVALVPPTGVPMRPWRAGERQKACSLARAIAPPRAQRLIPQWEERFRLSCEKRLAEWINRLIRRQKIHRWAVEEGGQFVATLIVQAMGPVAIGPHRLEIMVHPDHHGLLEEALVTRALSTLVHYPHRVIEAQVSADHQEAIHLLQRRGFVEVKTLDWLSLELTRQERRI